MDLLVQITQVFSFDSQEMFSINLFFVKISTESLLMIEFGHNLLTHIIVAICRMWGKAEQNYENYTTMQRCRF